MRWCSGVVLFPARRLNRTRRQRVVDEPLARGIKLCDEGHQQSVINAAARRIANFCGGCDVSVCLCCSLAVCSTDFFGDRFDCIFVGNVCVGGDYVSSVGVGLGGICTECASSVVVSAVTCW